MKPGPSGPRRAAWQTEPHPSRLRPEHPGRDAILAAHRRACASRLSTYRDPGSGYTVFTADYLAERGFCCSQGCRHCPWEGADEAPEPGRDPKPSDPST